MQKLSEPQKEEMLNLNEKLVVQIDNLVDLSERMYLRVNKIKNFLDQKTEGICEMKEPEDFTEALHLQLYRLGVLNERMTYILDHLSTLI